MPGKFLKHQETHSEAQASTGLSASIRVAYRWMEYALDLLYPPRCNGCGQVDTVWCVRCQQRLAQTPVNLSQTHVDGDFFAASTGVHQDILQSAVQVLKYAGALSLAAELGRRLAIALQSTDWTIDMIVPVPMHIDRLRQRGYNQAALIAQHLTSQTGLAYTDTALIRRWATRTQVGLGRQERILNVSEAFSATPEQCRGQNFLIVDDVLTTGATLAGCAAALHAAGASNVYGLTVTTARPADRDAGLV